MRRMKNAKRNETMKILVAIRCVCSLYESVVGGSDGKMFQFSKNPSILG